MSRSTRNESTPRAVVHKRILDAAKDRPDASMEDLARDIAGASTALVEQVLEEYGDPVEPSAASEPEAPDHDAMTGQDDGPDDGAQTDSSASPDIEDLSEKQLETLRTVRSRLSATQQEIGDALGLTASAVSNRLQDIEGFDWDDREAFVSELFDGPAIADGQGETLQAADTDAIEERLDALEARLNGLADDPGPTELPADLAHRVIHAVVRSDRIDEEEELEVIKALL